MIRSNEIAPLITQMTDRIVTRFHPDRVILFGSHATGTATPDSDVDLLVVMPIEGSKRQARLAIRAALHDIAVPKDVLVLTPEELGEQQAVMGTIARTAVREGRVLHAREG
jgi:predicted nucleotidyltransferase